jgi:thiol:disulfide interchange protein/DsbC/DsbD-like thiol-disulfide interchange protein
VAAITGRRTSINQKSRAGKPVRLFSFMQSITIGMCMLIQRPESKADRQLSHFSATCVFATGRNLRFVSGMIGRMTLAWLYTLCLFASAQFEFAANAPSTKSTLVPELKTLEAGKPFTIALRLEHPQGWHSYYQNSGGLEEGPSIRWTLPDGFAAGPIQWPAPTVKDGLLGKSFIYEGSPVFLVQIQTPQKLELGTTVTLQADATWQICSESCINETQSFTLALGVGSKAETDSSQAPLFAQARATLPQKISGTPQASSDGGDIVLCVNSDAAEITDFIPDQAFIRSALDGGAISRDGNAWTIRLPRAEKNALDQAIPQGNQISGILLGSQALRVDATPIDSSASSRAPKSGTSFLAILGGMFLGGLILNLMPCVFPVIGLKIMGFVQQAGADRRKVALHGMTFALGVLLSFGALSGILFAAREAAGGSAIGWGYQLQNPWVVLGLMLLMFVLALNLYGVFEIGTGAISIGGSLQSKQGIAGSLFSGILATLVATPCSAPFLGTAIGAAIALPAAQFFTAFAAMALGLALPYLVLSIFPNLVKFLPRPGAWMESFKQAMSFPLFATAGYLLWVYAGQIGLENLLSPIIGLTMIAIAAWIHGRWNLPHKSRSCRTAAGISAILIAAAGIWLAQPPKAQDLTWEPWSESRVAEMLTEQRPVYIDFTAQWCATCQVNKKRAYTKEVVALMKQKRVATLKADKTNPNPEIEAALRKLGRSAIPVNVFIAPGKEPVILPELLSPEDLLKLLKPL